MFREVHTEARHDGREYDRERIIKKSKQFTKLSLFSETDLAKGNAKKSNRNQKLSNNNIKEIVLLFKQKISITEIANKFGVCYHTVRYHLLKNFNEREFCIKLRKIQDHKKKIKEDYYKKKLCKE